jgi:hypothetical protein
MTCGIGIARRFSTRQLIISEIVEIESLSRFMN